MRKLRADEAADWFLRLKEDEVSEGELSAWLKWCADPENLREFQRTRHTWRGFDQLGAAASELLEILADERESSIRRVRATGGTHGARAGVPLPAARPLFWSRLGPLALAAMLVAIAIAGTWHAYESGMIKGSANGRPAPLAIRSTVLPDGSTLTLAPRTDVAVDFTSAQRRLALSEGEAYFKVRPDSSKPFIVHVAGLAVTAVGTAFNVRSRLNGVSVTVEDGVVEIDQVGDAGAANSGTWRVSAGYQLAYDVGRREARISAVDPRLALAWREGRLEYFSEPLASVVADVSRYTARRIELGDPELAALTFTGTVFTDSIDDWLEAVETTFPLRVIRRDDHVMLLRRPAAPERRTRP
ncbi:MAG: FecR family protein [Gammaproteobacteria bacterium]